MPGREDILAAVHAVADDVKELKELMRAMLAMMAAGEFDPKARKERADEAREIEKRLCADDDHSVAEAQPRHSQSAAAEVLARDAELLAALGPGGLWPAPTCSQ